MNRKKIAELTSKHMKNAPIAEVVAEMAAQDARWGADRDQPSYMWDSILSEEVGEVNEASLLLWSVTLGYKKGNISKHALEKNTEALRAELVQVAAVSMQWIEALDRESLVK
ncbi:hypothetical protein M3894_002887 [Vibrio metschnikovii]|nr:hypothetical protein [Vibrio metschnikovii]